MSEHMGQFYQRTYGLEFVALRFSQTYGPGKTVAKWGNRAVVSQIIEGACSGTPVRVEKGGDQKNDFLYTKDAALGIYLACTKRDIHHSAYNIGTGVGARADIQIGPGLSVLNEPRAAIFDISRARQDLGFSPRFPTAKAVEDYVTTLRRLGSD
jgi:UDP-glucose 4-epimerase